MIKFPSKLSFSVYFTLRICDILLKMHNAFLVARQSGKIIRSFSLIRFVLKAIKALDPSDYCGGTRFENFGVGLVGRRYACVRRIIIGNQMENVERT